MKIVLRTLMLLLVPVSAFGHSELFFPRVLSPAEFATTGFAVVNPDSFTATIDFLLIPATGNGLVASTRLTIQPRGQLSRLASELFPNAATGGWVGAVSDGEGVQGFWLNYDSGLTFLDGAEATQLDTIGADQIIPLVAGQAELNVANPHGIVMPVSIRLFGNNGELASASREIPPLGGALQIQVQDLFPSVDLTQARYIRLQSPGAPMASMLLIRDFFVRADSAVVVGTNVPSLATMSFPHVISGAYSGADYTTFIGVTNLTSSSQNVTITFYPDGGNSRQAVRTIPGNGALRETARDLFSLSPEFQGGWVSVSGTGPIAGFAAYADSIAGGMAVVPAGTEHTSLFFSHIAAGPPQWQTGLALLNSTGTPALVEIYALNSSGTLIGATSTFTLQPGTKTAKAIHELIPQTRGINGGFVYVRTTNNVPLHGIELFYTEDLKVLSNVAAGKLAAGVVFVPPVP